MKGVYSGQSDSLVLPKSWSSIKYRQKPSCFWTKKWPEPCDGADLALNKGQIWTQHSMPKTLITTFCLTILIDLDFS